MTNVLAAVRMLDRNADRDPLDAIAAAQGDASMEAEGRFAQFLESEGVDSEQARLLAAVALVRFIEGATPADLLRLVNPFDGLLRPPARA